MSSYEGSLWMDEELLDTVIDRLRVLGSDSTIFAADIINDQHAEIKRRGAEIERLHTLIIAWADADDDPADIDGPYHAAWLALRRAVGR
jgi:hypothetical protein